MKTDNLIGKKKIMKCLVLSVILSIILILNSANGLSLTLDTYKVWCDAGQYGSPAQWKYDARGWIDGHDVCGTDICLNVYNPSTSSDGSCNIEASAAGGLTACCRSLVTTPTTQACQCSVAGPCCDGCYFRPAGSECGMRYCDTLSGYFITGPQSPSTISYCNYRFYDNVPAYCSGYSDECIFTPTCNVYVDTLEINTAGTCTYIDGCDGNTPGTIVYYESNTQGPTPDEYIIEGQNTANSTSRCKHLDWHCTGDSAAEVSDSIIQAEAGICEVITGCSGADIPGTVELSPATQVCNENLYETFSCEDGGGPDNPGSDVLITRTIKHCDGINEGCGGAITQLSPEVYDDCPDTSYCDPALNPIACAPLFRLNNLALGLSLIDKSTGQDLRGKYVVGLKDTLLKEGTNTIADLDVLFDRDLDWSDIAAGSNGEKVFLHIPSGHDEIVGDRIMYVPADKNTGTVYVCPDADSFSDINPDCYGLYYETDLDVINGYYEVNITETGAEELDIFSIEGWTQLVDDPYSPGITISVSTESVDGSYSLLIDDGSAEQFGIGSDFITIQGGGDYALSVDTKCDASMDIVLEVYNQTNISIEEPVATAVSDWLANDIIVSTNSDDEKVRIVFKSRASGTGKCYFDNVKFATGTSTLDITEAPEGIEDKGCCPADYCWDGTTCIGDMSESGESIEMGGQFLRCADGDWVEPIVRYNWDNDNFSFCKREDQCFVDINGAVDNDDMPEMYVGLGDSQNPRCIGDGQFIEDHYCDNGKWTSRTKFVATQLLEIKGDTNSFTLYCDSYDKIFWDPIKKEVILSETQEILIRGLDHSTSFELLSGHPPTYSCFPDKYDDYGYEAHCVNNICRLDYDNDEKLAFGMAVNKQVNFSLGIPGRADSVYFLEELFGVDYFYCDSLIGDNQNFSKCSNDPIFWYSDILNSIIKSKIEQPINFQPPSIWDGIVNFFTGLFGGAPTATLSTAINFSFLEQTKDFNKICISKQGDKTAYMVVENPKPSIYYVAAKYENVGDDICRLIEERTFSGIRNCTKEGNNYTIYAGINITVDPELRIAEIDDLWEDVVYSCRSLN